MSWDKLKDIEAELKRALDTFDWPKVEAVCEQLRARIRSEHRLMPEPAAEGILKDLRRKRRFAQMASVADALLQSGLRTPRIRIQYAQALVDQGELGAAELILQSVLHDFRGATGEVLEARGLTGRVYKQIYVDTNDPTSRRNRENLARSLHEYFDVYRLNPYENLWHGVNVVALLWRARRDKLPPAGLPDAAALARDLLETIADRELRITKPSDSLPAWDLATRLEVYVALGLHEREEEARQKYFRMAESEALRYISHPEADAFEIASTRRQFVEVWQLDDKTPPGDHLLPILNAGHLSKQGSVVEKNPHKVEEEAAVVQNAVDELEAIFGTDKMVTLKWYKQGLDRCNAVARVEKTNGRGHGTGWLVRAEDFFPGRTGVLLLTNAHVVSDDPNPFTNPLAIFPEDARVNFRAGEKDVIFTVREEIVKTSPPNEFDATFLEIEGEPPASPLVIHPRALEMAEPPPRLYIIGHPAGRDVELSLHDNYLLGCDERLVHYRTPTERGSSGSPVFEPEDWRVVALHHKGSDALPRIDGRPGTYEANEGIAVGAIRKWTAEA
jgi:Trypsin-like peptidase domain/MAP3K TRAFs-binding domain